MRCGLKSYYFRICTQYCIVTFLFYIANNQVFALGSGYFDSTRMILVETKMNIVSTCPTFESTKPANVSTNPTHVITKPANVITKPANVATCHADVSTSPTHVCTKPADVSTTPTHVSIKPANVSPKPCNVGLLKQHAFKSIATEKTGIQLAGILFADAKNIQIIESDHMPRAKILCALA
jgi:hypothetical protein